LPAHASSSVVQQAMALMVEAGGNPTPGQTISASFPSNVASGNLVAVGVASGDANVNPQATVESVSDTRGSSFIQAVFVTNAVNEYAYIYYATLSSSGPDTVTVTFTSDLSDDNGMAYLFIYEVSGVTTIGVATATGIGWSSGSVSTSSSISFGNGAFILAIMAGQIFSSSWTAGSGFQFSPTHPYDQFIQLAKGMYSISGVFSPTNFPATLSQTQNWIEVGIALNPLPPGPVMHSQLTSSPPSIDGTVQLGEWSNLVISFTSPTYPDSYVLPTYVYFMNDVSNLYVLVDAVGDTTNEVSDECLLIFDFNSNPNDGYVVVRIVQTGIDPLTWSKSSGDFDAAIGMAVTHSTKCTSSVSRSVFSAVGQETLSTFVHLSGKPQQPVACPMILRTVTTMFGLRYWEPVRLG
jgi:hypothetical protein